MYHEGWWGPFYIRLVYLIPGTAFLLLTLLAIRWPKIGGWLIVVLGTAFTIFFMDIHVVDGRLTIDRDVAGFLVSGPLVLIGVLFLIEARNQRKRRVKGWQPDRRWIVRHGWSFAAISVPVVIFILMSVINLPMVLSRKDDGWRGISKIEGNGVSLIWAPEGPGWNWMQDYGGYPSWDMVALYGKDPVGINHKLQRGDHASQSEMEKYNLCLYLSEDGLHLEPEAQNIWRMPTIDDYARALTWRGENAGCTWDGKLNARLECLTQTNKETPLWAPNLSPIYYWAFEEYDEETAYFVSYNGWVNRANKAGGNPRHSYRCVRD